jgi:hypothetical protein
MVAVGIEYWASHYIKTEEEVNFSLTTLVLVFIHTWALEG